MTQCLCACPSVAPFVILDALMLASELGQKYAIINYPSQGTPNLQVNHGPSRKPSQTLRHVHSVCVNKISGSAKSIVDTYLAEQTKATLHGKVRFPQEFHQSSVLGDAHVANAHIRHRRTRGQVAKKRLAVFDLGVRLASGKVAQLRPWVGDGGRSGRNQRKWNTPTE